MTETPVMPIPTETSDAAERDRLLRETVRTLSVMTSVVHYRYENRIWGYGPYVREMLVWAEIFPQLVLASPCRTGKPPSDYLPFDCDNVSIRPVVETGGYGFVPKAKQILSLPLLLWQTCNAMRAADAIHVRAPGNLGLLGALLAPLFSRRLVAKFAGQWSDFKGEPLTYRIQRAVLGSRWFHGPVTVYGEWPNQPPNVVPFFSTAFTDRQLDRARIAARDKEFGKPVRLLFVGRLSQAKHVDTLISALGELKKQGLTATCTVVGTGPEHDELVALAKSLDVAEQVTFVGGVEFDQVLGYYERSDVLVLASETEGWPKAIMEGMAFGLFCIGSDRGFVPTMLAGRGANVPPGDVTALANVLREIVLDPRKYEQTAASGAEWAQGYSLEYLGESLRKLLAERWNIHPPANAAKSVAKFAPNAYGGDPAHR